jgi:hypothetical protein
MALLGARYMVVFLKRPGGQSQFSGYLVSEATHRPDLRALQMWIMEHPAEDLRIEVLAERVAMSPRNFARVFQEETGMTPAKFVEKPGSTPLAISWAPAITASKPWPSFRVSAIPSACGGPSSAIWASTRRTIAPDSGCKVCNQRL